MWQVIFMKKNKHIVCQQTPQTRFAAMIFWCKRGKRKWEPSEIRALPVILHSSVNYLLLPSLCSVRKY